MRKTISLSQYVKKRNGVSLGAKRSMRKMLYRSFGAKSFSEFWYYWNPIWSFYLAKFVLRPVKKHTSAWIAILATFSISGLLHDLAISLFYMDTYVFFTPWFALMGLLVLLTQKYSVSFSSYQWFVRALANSIFIIFSFSIVRLLSF
ncbi:MULTISPECIES: acyltransferase [unclassified Alteromonas]|uniref:acyltransferase n=1 Tax=unclassified Alteromonas TaxID=2614992 RepID=UPI0019227233|nr:MULTISPECIES: acyltransferase [unclassified Alteromonas]